MCVEAGVQQNAWARWPRNNMDIHRCRFVPYPPSAINALAFSHASSTSTKGKGPSTLRLAVGRANGDIEIWNPLRGSWFQESILRGGKDRSIEGLAWTQDPDHEDHSGWKVPGKLRLFSIGYSSAVTEWDLNLGRPVRHSSGNHGEVWCLAAQPKWRASGQGTEKSIEREGEFRGQYLAAGCADGSVVLFSTAEGDLQYLRTLTRPSTKRARVLSITFQNRYTIIAGYADSTIRIINVRNEQVMRSMSLGAGPTGGPKETLVWSVKCLPDGTIVSGDSTGEVKFWDGQNYSLLQRIKSHLADILDIATNADGNTVVSGGMDRRTTVYKRIGSGKRGDRHRWAEISHKRYHQHDVKIMATFETKHLSVLASGGLDTVPTIIPLRELGRENSRALPCLPQLPQIESAPRKRLLMCWWEGEISIWRMGGPASAQQDGIEEEQDIEVRSRKLVARIALKGEESIVSVSLAVNGSMLAVATISDVKVFRLRRRRSSGDALRVQKINLPKSIWSTGAKLIKFSPDSRWLILVRSDSAVQCCRIQLPSSSQEHPHLLSKIVVLERLTRDVAAPKLQHGTLGDYDRSINRIAFSADSRILCASDVSGYIDSWLLEGHEDLTQEADEDGDDAKSSISSGGDDSNEEKTPVIVLGQHWIRNPVGSLLPKLPSTPLVLSFRPSRASYLSSITDGNIAVHPTRHTPHPHSRDLPNGEDRLFVMTCEHQMYELKVMSGRLSDWSRRNPTSSLPRDFRGVLDRIIGAVWDLEHGHERIWLYGSAWLWMFDLSKDLPRLSQPDNHSAEEDGSNDAPTANKLKRKRKRERMASERQDHQDLRKHTTGAGSKIPEKELDVGLGRRFRKTTYDGDTEKSEWIPVNREHTSSSEDESDDDEQAGALARIRRVAQGEIQTRGHIDSEDSVGNADGDFAVAKKPAGDGPVFWHTYKYRPIMGIVPLSPKMDLNDEDCASGLDPQTLEVALVERPLWDVDLPPRYYGDQEWDKS